MSTAIRNHRQRPSCEWGVIETHSIRGFGQSTPVWLACWIELAPFGRLSIDVDPDRDATITPATWDRACRALGPPLRIVVHELETAERVRLVVPPEVLIIFGPDDPLLTRLAARIERGLDVGELDFVPFPTPRARS